MNYSQCTNTFRLHEKTLQKNSAPAFGCLEGQTNAADQQVHKMSNDCSAQLQADIEEVLEATMAYWSKILAFKGQSVQKVHNLSPYQSMKALVSPGLQ